jgi:phage tail sheath protein FI
MPTNAAEQYFYQTAKAVVNSSRARLLVTRLPYGVEKGEGFTSWRYSALAYPARAVNNVKTYELNTVTIVNAGSGYNSVPAVTLTGGVAYLSADAVVTASLNASLSTVNVSITTNGLYTSAPTTIAIAAPTTLATLSTLNPLYNSIGQATAIFTTNEILTGFVDVTQTQGVGLSGADTYLFGTPTHIELSAEQYQNVIAGNIDWTNNPDVTNKNTTFSYNTLKDAGMIILNKAQTSVNNMFEGYYVGIIDNNNYNPATPFNGVLTVNGIQASLERTNNYVEVPETRLNFLLSSTKFGDGASVSEVMENLSQVDLNNRDYDDTITVGIFKLRKSIFTPDTISLDYILTESLVGSLDYHRQVADQNGGSPKSFYVGEKSESSPNIRIHVNPWISNRFGNSWITTGTTPTKKVRFLSNQLKTKFAAPGFIDTDASYNSRVGADVATINTAFTQLGTTDALYTLGVYSDTTVSDKKIGGLVGKLERAFELVENFDVYPLNLACEAGLGTIFVNALAQSNNASDTEQLSAGSFIDSTPLNSLSSLYTTQFDQISQEGETIRSRYTAVANVFVNAAEKQRKDFMVILDPLRNIFVQGSNSKVITTTKQYGPNAGASGNEYAPGYTSTNFSQHIYWPLRHQFGTINSSYAATYATWAQVIDGKSNRVVWAPFSGFAAATMANTDRDFQPWFAPAGFTRGVLVGVNDLGVYPKLKQRDLLYKISLNPVAFFPAEGFVIFGQKTLLKKPSAFDRINVRRLFLNLEVATRDTVKFFVFEPNTLFTRTQVVNVLAPIFENAKNTEGLYDYLIVCDERNNTPDVIDNNELKIDIYIKPVRTAEFILVTFYATRTGQDFQELIGG